MVSWGFSDVGVGEGVCLAGLMQSDSDTCMKNSVFGQFNLVAGTFSDGKPRERG